MSEDETGSRETADGGSETAGVARRRVLETVGAGTLLPTGTGDGPLRLDWEGGPTDDRAVDLEDPPRLVAGFFKIVPPEGSDDAGDGVETAGDILFRLDFESGTELTDAERDAVVDRLDVAPFEDRVPTVRREPGLNLDFFERYRLDDVGFDDLAEESDVAFDEAARDRFNELRRQRENLKTLRGFSGASIEGRIEGGASVPPEPARFRGGRTTCAEVVYDGPVVEFDREDLSTQRRFAVQFQDGFIYQFPLAVPEYPYDARYDIGSLRSNKPRTNRVGSDSNEFTTETFTVDTPESVDRLRRAVLAEEEAERGVVVPEFDHRAHPALPVLRSLAQRRAILLVQYSQLVGVDLDQVVNEVGLTAIDASYSVLGAFQTVPPNPLEAVDPVDYFNALALAGAPVLVAAGASAAGAPALAATVSLLATAQSLTGAVRNMLAFGERIDDFAEELPELSAQSLQYDVQCPGSDEEANEEADEKGNEEPFPQCLSPEDVGDSIDFQSTPLALGELSWFEARFGPRALSRAPDREAFDANTETYRALSAEYAEQADLFQRTLDTDSGGARRVDPEVRETLSPLIDQLSSGGGPGPLQREQNELIRQVEDAFDEPTAVIDPPAALVVGEDLTFSAEPSVVPFGSASYRWTVRNAETGTEVATGTDSTLTLERGTLRRGVSYEVELAVSAAETDDDPAVATRTVSPSNPPEARRRALRIADVDDASAVGVLDVAEAAVGLVRDRPVNGVSVTTRDVSSLITLLLRNG